MALLEYMLHSLCSCSEGEDYSEVDDDDDDDGADYDDDDDDSCKAPACRLAAERPTTWLNRLHSCRAGVDSFPRSSGSCSGMTDCVSL